ncbi:MAG: baseplate J/gp47 family protein, partial [Planctomycetes bacterium]|nr:baseplate J/gp47 family protein [Planctomycetota bacterium]
AGRFRLRRLLRGGTAIESAALRPGPATVRLPSLSVTLGERGNVPAGSVTILEGPVTGVARALQPLAASGGLDPEAPENVRRRVLASWRTGGRAVTAADFRRLVPALDPEVARVEAAADPRAPWLVTVCVVADGQPGPGRLAPARLRWIEERLQEKAPLGTVVEVVEPRYVPVEVIVRCDEGVPPPPEGQRRRLEEELRGYLHPVRGGRDGAGFPHGTWLTSDEAAAIMARALAGERPAAGLGGSSWRPSRIEVRGPTPDAEAPRGSPLVIPLLERLSFEDLGR